MNWFLTFFFEGLAGGWSELMPIVQSNSASASTAASNIANARIAIMANDAFLIGARLSLAEEKGDSWPLSLALPLTGTFGAPTDKTYQRLRTCLRMKFTTLDALHRGTRFIRAIPQSQITDGAYSPTTPFGTALTAYIASLTASALAVASRNKTPPPFWTFNAAVTSGVPNLTERKIGRPFDLYRGRRLIA